MQSLEERRRPKLGEDVVSLFGRSRIWVVGAEQHYEIQLAQRQVEGAVERPPRLDGPPVRIGRFFRARPTRPPR